MQLRLSPKNRIIRFAYPFGCGRYMSLCRLFWKSVFMRLVWSAFCIAAGYVVAVTIVYPKDAAIAILTVVILVAITVLTVCGLDIVYYLWRHNVTDRVTDTVSAIVDTTPAQLIYAGYKGIKQRFCPIIIIAERGDAEEDVVF